MVIQNVRIFDGEKVLGQTSISFQNGKITGLGNITTDGAGVIDGTGKTLLPGLIDAHVHVFGNVLKQGLIFGVTTELDMFTDPKTAANIKKQQAEGKMKDSADLRSAGYLATAPGGHGTEYGMPVPTISSPGEAQAWVDARIAEGSDYIKIVYDDGLTYFTKPIPTISKETMAALCTAAHNRGKLAVIHIGSLQGAEDAINAGADGLAHLFAGEHSEPNFGKLAAAHHVFVVPTYSVVESICGGTDNPKLATDPRLAPYLSEPEAANLRASFPLEPSLPHSCKGAEEAILQLKAAHVPMLAGSDVPNPGTSQGATIHGELAQFVRIGLTPMEALVAATSAPAKAFHLDDRGRIAVGQRADLLLVNGDPTTDIYATRDIVSVWKVGQEANRKGFLASLEKGREQAAKDRQKPAPAGSESGLVSDFEGATPTAQFGAGWVISTDSIMGGKSKAEMKIIPGGANGTKQALQVTGEVVAGTAFAWGGVMFSPGPGPMTPANLSGKKSVSFWAKGDGKTYRLMIFTQNRGFSPITKTFVAGPDWKQVSFPLAAFDGIDGRDVLGFVFCAGTAPRLFDFSIDEMRLDR